MALVAAHSGSFVPTRSVQELLPFLLSLIVVTLPLLSIPRLNPAWQEEEEEFNQPPAIASSSVIKKYLSWWWLPFLILVPFFGTGKILTGALSYAILGIIAYSILYFVKLCWRLVNKANTKTK